MNDPKRILVVVLGFILLCGFAFEIKGHMEGEGYKRQVRYTTAIQVTDKDHFNYAVDSQQGNLLADGQFTADKNNLVKFPEMTEGFTYVERTQEHYTMHTQTYTCGKSICVRTYYEWDSIDHEAQLASKLSLFGREYNTGLFNLSNYTENQSCEGITVNDTNSGWLSSKHGCSGSDYYLDNDDRYSYKIVPQAFTATFLASSMGGGLNPVNENAITLENKNIDQVLKDVGKYKLWAFWVCLTIIFFLFVGAAIGAYQWVMADGVWDSHK